MQALGAEFARRRVRVRDNFQDFDRLRSGLVTVDQFRRVLGMTDALKVVTTAEVDAIISRYAEGNTFRYIAFLEDLEPLELAASIPAARSERTLPSPGTVAYRLFELCNQQASATGLDPRRSFQPFDKHNTGKITATQFDRCFPFRLDAAQIAVMKAPYQSGADVNYLDFCRDLALFAGQANAAAKTAPLPEWADNTIGGAAAIESPVRRRQNCNDVDTTLAELKFNLQKEQVNVNDAFREFDKLRSGVVSSGQFTSALGRIVLRGFKLTNEALSNLIATYKVDATSERVSYARFLRDLDAAAQGGPQLAEMDDADTQRLNQVLGKVRSAIRTRRVNLKPTFQDFDRANKGIFLGLTCTRSRFERVLAVNGITLSATEIDLLERRYSVHRANETDTDAVNYIAFCRDVDLPDNQLESPSTVRPVPTFGTGTFNATTGTTLVKKQLGLEAVIDIALIQIADRSIRLHEFIRDHDPLRAGLIPRDKLATAISVSGLRLESDQVKTLLDAFTAAGDKSQIAYPKLLAALDTDAPGEDPALHKVDEARARVTAEVQAATAAMHSEQLDAILERIRDDVAARHILLPPFFQDYDKHHRGTITAAQFERVICRHRLPVSTADIGVLKQYFADPADANNVRCRDFIASVDQAEASRLPKYLRQTTTTQEASASAVAAPRVAADASATLAEVLGKVSGFVLSRSLRISEFFRDADPLRKGFCHESRFGGALNGLGIGLTDAEHATLRLAYRSTRGPNAVDYDRFVAEIDALEFQKAAGATDLAVSDGTILKAPLPHGDYDDAKTSVAADPFLAKLIGNVSSTAQARRMSVRATVQDFDRLRKGRIPQSQFFSALSANGIKFNALETSKLVELLGGEGKSINYSIFCKLVEESA